MPWPPIDRLLCCLREVVRAAHCSNHWYRSWAVKVGLPSFSRDNSVESGTLLRLSSDNHIMLIGRLCKMVTAQAFLVLMKICQQMLRKTCTLISSVRSCLYHAASLWAVMSVGTFVQEMDDQLPYACCGTASSVFCHRSSEQQWSCHCPGDQIETTGQTSQSGCTLSD